MSRSTQDYIVRQRYSNALPPPPGAPKLLEIPTGGLTQYTMPTYASRLARMHPLNIEADAELGMPIDLVGMPGVFEGDESAILAPLLRPTPHPDDRNLLRPLKEIGQAKKEGGISFLRRTQYTAEGGVGKGLVQSSNLGINPKRRRLDTSKEDPKAILRTVIKGFDIANPTSIQSGPDTENFRGAQPSMAELEAWKTPKNPKNPSAKPIGFYPVLPDLDTIPTDGGYMVTRFIGNPGEVEGDRTVIPSESRTDPRIETSLLMVTGPDEDVNAEYQARSTRYIEDPENEKNPGGQPLNFQFFLPDDLEVTAQAKKAFDPDLTTMEQAENLYTNGGDEEKRHFKFKHARFYETRSNILHSMPYSTVAMVLHDEDPTNDDDLGLGSDDEEERVRKLPRGAYFTPIVSTHSIRPKRQIVDKFGRDGVNDSEKIDILAVRIGEFGEEEKEKRSKILADLQETCVE